MSNSGSKPSPYKEPSTGNFSPLNQRMMKQSSSSSTLAGSYRIPVTFSSMKQMKKHKEVLKEDTMSRISSMGLRAPNAWVNQLYQNELKKIDVKHEQEHLLKSLFANKGTLKASSLLKDNRFDLERYSGKFFDRSYEQDF